MVVIDHLTVLVAATVGFLVSCLWYSRFLFGSTGRKKKKTAIAYNIFAYIVSFFLYVMISYGLALIEGYFDVTSFWDGVIAAAIIWTTIVLPIYLYGLIWHRKQLVVFVLDLFLWLISFIAIGGILAG